MWLRRHRLHHPPQCRTMATATVLASTVALLTCQARLLAPEATRHLALTPALVVAAAQKRNALPRWPTETPSRGHFACNACSPSERRRCPACDLRTPRPSAS